MVYLRFIKRKHECVLPTSLNRKRGGRAVGVGTIWECSHCKKQWIVTERDLPDGREQYWKPLNKNQYIKKGE